MQGEIQRVLCKLEGGRPVRLRGAGRTDAGVHARAQVADAGLSSRLTDDELAYRLRRMLPPDVRPVAVATVRHDFHARHDALDKTYMPNRCRSARRLPLASLKCPRPSL